MMKYFFLLLAAFFVSGFASSQPVQFRGPNRDGIFHETGLLKSWPENGPELLFEIEGIGDGWSSAVEYNSMIYITGKIDTNDVLSAINQNGEISWQTVYGRSWEKTFPDTRSTPTMENGNAYLVSGMGEVVCIEIQTGKIRWKNNAFEENNGSAGRWGIAESVLLYENKAFFSTGGEETMMIALDKNNGEIVWKTKSLNDNIAYVSPIKVEMNGQTQIIGVSASYIYGVNPDNGEIVWKFDYQNFDDSEWDNSGGVINCTSPIFHNGHIYLTSGYNHIGLQFKLNDDLSGVELVWQDHTLDNHHGGVVVVDGYIYGSNWINNGKGNWCCLNFATGETMWEEKFRNKGSIIYADEMLYIYSEHHGYVGLVRPTPEKFDLVSSFRITEGRGPHWAHPAIYNGKLYIRHGNFLFVYNIKA